MVNEFGMIGFNLLAYSDETKEKVRTEILGV